MWFVSPLSHLSRCTTSFPPLVLAFTDPGLGSLCSPQPSKTKYSRFVALSEYIPPAKIHRPCFLNLAQWSVYLEWKCSERRSRGAQHGWLKGKVMTLSACVFGSCETTAGSSPQLLHCNSTLLLTSQRYWYWLLLECTALHPMLHLHQQTSSYRALAYAAALCLWWKLLASLNWRRITAKIFSFRKLTSITLKWYSSLSSYPFTLIFLYNTPVRKNLFITVWTMKSSVEG